MHSAIYTGQLRHRRFAPRAHEFSYPLFMMYVDLAELDTIFSGRWLWSAKRPAFAWLRRADYLGNAQVPIDEAVRDRVQLETGARPNGPIRMLTHLRYFGVGINPVTFYYCFDAEDTKVETIVAEITNTPWKERYAYVLSRRNSFLTPSPRTGEGIRVLRFRFKKSFHVSPFMPMQIDYDWRFSTPAAQLTVHMQNMQSDNKVFDATLAITRHEITSASLAKTLIAFPCVTAKVIVGIYWQALRLWLKRIPFHTHPPSSIKTSTDHEHDARPSSIT
jgi:uncharacterized protein